MKKGNPKKNISSGSGVSNLDSVLQDRILKLTIRKDLLDKFHEEEKRSKVASLIDLRELTGKSETEVYQTLNRMYKNKQ